MAQDVDVSDRFPAASDQDRDIHQHPTTAVGRGEPPPGEGAGQDVGHADLVGQQPGCHVPRVRHHARPISGEGQTREPRRMLHLRSAFRNGETEP